MERSGSLARLAPIVTPCSIVRMQGWCGRQRDYMLSHGKKHQAFMLPWCHSCCRRIYRAWTKRKKNTSFRPAGYLKNEVRSPHGHTTMFDGQGVAICRCWYVPISVFERTCIRLIAKHYGCYKEVRMKVHAWSKNEIGRRAVVRHFRFSTRSWLLILRAMVSYKRCIECNTNIFITLRWPSATGYLP